MRARSLRSPRPARGSWLVRHRDLLPLAVVVLPMLHWSISPPKS